MGPTLHCGRCGTVLVGPSTRCPACGAAPGGTLRPARFSGARPPRSPVTAAVLAALVPGLGHVYLGQNLKGALYFAGVAGLGFFGLDLDLTAIGAAVGIPMELGGFGLWVHNVVDAYRQAKYMQRQAA